MIRRYRPSDLKKAAEVFRAAFAAEPWNEDWTLELAETRINELMSAPQSIGYVSENNGAVQAILCGRKLTYLHGAEYVIDEFCVSPDIQRSGIGSAVLDHVSKELTGEGAAAMVLLTTRGYPSERFYIKNGFTASDTMIFMYRPIKNKECSNDKT
ncbi:GNAT family N-acetyltransferase [Ruminococcus sp.]|jgi:ribosomal protein S18 acetylase RimI-like enzyme|uniref:GNAT family N-acetyltransferase n=1 Tax=Ruminococcus sp. TaxID=41978 RepID=UPI0025E03D37|nr:GNAT family N-acetyltransferase [Ruminococcus sp.]MCR4640024.1 GNAT family N-acetyltransferase [Ruminococcus sp.]